MASIASAQALFSTNSAVKRECQPTKSTTFVGSKVFPSFKTSGVYGINKKKSRPLTVVAAFGDVSSDGTTYLIAGAIGIALIGTAFPILFSRKDLCPECDGAGFIRRGGATLKANAARKDQAQIVCPNCNGLGKLNQIDK
ncbi:OLC1v1034913C2 [Oldenlandia corymbosa var. corymbosa]|uniref:OLC1v1034913C2 n=1 Tax=Oldenlandia corymbosa var. corymbosa TaxID=529605 RepID=A0AAV1CUW8_OLDCO|nr:OLC1v1034913C2 [Oldenlandia corymbosa var. corymbosa]